MNSSPNPARARVLGVALAASVVAAACGASTTAAVRPTRSGPPAEYRLGVEDLVEVLVWREPQLSTTVPVRPDGRINLPLVGEIQAAGRTATEVQQEVAGRLGKTLTSPVVSVAVKEINSARVFVTGEVQRPGAFPLRGGMTVEQALALAGGPTEFASTRRIHVVRRLADGKTVRLAPTYKDSLGGSVDLLPGDMVVVP